MPTEHCVSGLACTKVCSALKMAEGKQEKRWLFTDDMVEKLIYFLETVKVRMIWLVAKWSVANVQHAKHTLYMNDFSLPTHFMSISCNHSRLSSRSHVMSL